VFKLNVNFVGKTGVR